MLFGQVFCWACLPSHSYVQLVGQVVDGLQEMVGPLFPSSCDLSSSRRPDKAFFYGSGTLPTGQAPNPRAYHASTCMVFAYVPLAKASHKANPRVNVGEDYIRIQMHESRIHWKSLLLQSDTGAKSGNRREQLGGSTITQKRNDDGLYQGDDNGSFKKCLDSEYSWKNDLICILLSH